MHSDQVCVQVCSENCPVSSFYSAYCPFGILLADNFTCVIWLRHFSGNYFSYLRICRSNEIAPYPELGSAEPVKKVERKMIVTHLKNIFMQKKSIICSKTI